MINILIAYLEIQEYCNTVQTVLCILTYIAYMYISYILGSRDFYCNIQEIKQQGKVIDLIKKSFQNK